MKIFIIIFLICFFPLSSIQDHSLGPPSIPDNLNDRQFMWSTYVLTHGARIPAYQVYPTDRTCHVVEGNGVVVGIFEYTNSKHRFLGKDPEYSIPDFVESLDEREQGEEITMYYEFNNLTGTPMLEMDGFKVENETFFSSKGYSTGAYVWPFIRSCEYPDSISLQGRHTVNSYEVKLENAKDLINNGRLSKDFFDFINGLPKTYENNREKYEKFIKMIGTHYWDRAEFGHVYMLNHETTPELFWKYQDNLEKGIKKAASKQKQYESHGHTSDYYYYGAGLPFENDDDWHRGNWKKFYSDQWIIGGDLLLISNLIANATIRNQVEIATRAYFDHKFLDYVQDGLDKLKNSGDYKIISPYHYELLIDANQRLDIPIEDDMQLIKDIVFGNLLLWDLIRCNSASLNAGVVELCKNK